ncbi:MAG: hypothetical protein AB7O62_06825 [Pirellulales bacterium]
MARRLLRSEKHRSPAFADFSDRQQQIEQHASQLLDQLLRFPEGETVVADGLCAAAENSSWRILKKIETLCASEENRPR